MPAYETMFKELLIALEQQGIRAQLADLLEGGATLSEIVDSLGVAQNAGQLDFIGQAPASLQAAILAVVRENLSRDTPKQMMFTWAPGYDWEMRLWESTSSVVSAGGITVQVRSRYPGDPHPGLTAG